MSFYNPFPPEKLISLFGFKDKALDKNPLTDTCDYCGEETEEDLTAFGIGRKEVFMCPCCTNKQRNENPRSEIL